MDNQKGQPAQAGISLIITLFIMIIVLAVVLSISALLYSEAKVIRNIGNSIVSFYAADSGVEKVLYYDRQVLPAMTGDKIAKRGLCSMYMYDSGSNPNACMSKDPNSPNLFADDSIYCEPNSGFMFPVTGPTDNSHGCDYDVCDDCKISFSTTFDNRKYSVTAAVYLQRDEATGKDIKVFEVESKGYFGGAQRQVQTFTTPLPD